MFVVPMERSLVHFQRFQRFSRVNVSLEFERQMWILIKSKIILQTFVDSSTFLTASAKTKLIYNKSM